MSADVPFNGKLEVIAIDELRSTDVVILSLPQKTLSAQEAHICEQFMRGAFPRNKHILLVNGQKLKIMRPPEAKGPPTPPQKLDV